MLLFQILSGLSWFAPRFTVLRFSSVNQIYLVSTVWNTQIEKTKFFHVLIESFKVYSLFSYQGSYSLYFVKALEAASQLHCCQSVLDDSLLTISSLNFFVNNFFLFPITLFKWFHFVLSNATTFIRYHISSHLSITFSEKNRTIHIFK